MFSRKISSNVPSTSTHSHQHLRKKHFRDHKLPEHHHHSDFFSSSDLIPAAISFFYIRKNLKALDSARVRRPFLRSIHLVYENSSINSSLYSEKLNSFCKSRNIQKHLKYLRYLELQLSYLTNIDRIFLKCRSAKYIKLNLGSFGYSSRTLGHKDVLPLLKFSINKLTKGLLVLDHWHMFESLRQTRMLLGMLKLHPIEEFSYDSEFPSNNLPASPESIFGEMIQSINQAVYNMRWLKYLYLGSIHQYLQPNCKYERTLNRFKNLRELKLLNCYPLKMPFLEDAVQFSSIEYTFRFFSNLNPLQKLVSISLDINDASVAFFRVLTQSEARLSKLHLNIVKFEDLMYVNTTIPCGFQEVWLKVKQFTTLRDFKLSHTSLLEDEWPTSYLLGSTPIAQLSLLTRFSLNLNPVRRKLFDYSELGNALSKLPDLVYLRMSCHTSSKDFITFLRSSGPLEKLIDLDLDLDFYEEIWITKDFMTWCKNKVNLKYLQLQIGSKMNIGGDPSLFKPDSLNNFCDAVTSIPRLIYVKLCLGCLRYSFPDKLPPFKGFHSFSSKSIISSMLKRMNSVKKLIMDIGAGYFEDDELQRIGSAFRHMKELKFLAFGGNFANISFDGYTHFSDEIKQLIDIGRLKTLVIRTVEYYGRNEKSLIQKIEEIFGIQSAQRFYLNQIEL